MKRFRSSAPAFLLAAVLPLTVAAQLSAAPKVILISLDGATPSVLNPLIANGTIPAGTGLALLRSAGIRALTNTTITPSITAPAHIAIATGSTAANNDIFGNTFHLVSSPFNNNVSGFGAPIGGYQLAQPSASPPVAASPTANPTAEPLWVRARAAGKTVVTATWPGGDGLNVLLPGTSTVVQNSAARTVDYTIPFGAATAPFQRGFNLTASSFSADATVSSQLTAAGVTFFNAVATGTLETFFCSPATSPTVPTAVCSTNTIAGGTRYDIRVAALDTTDDGVVNYNMLVFFDSTRGIQPGPFTLPATGPAYVARPTSNPDGTISVNSGRFFLEGSYFNVGMTFYVANLAPDLSTVRFAHSSATYIPRTKQAGVLLDPAPLANVDDINRNVGFWAAQSDFRIVERIDATPSSFVSFPDQELEGIYEEQTRDFVDFQTRIGLRAINQNPNADVVMIYIEQPDGSGHQFTLTDPRQSTNFSTPQIGANQDPSRVARYRKYVQFAYQTASSAVDRIVNAPQVGLTNGVPNSNVFVVSDHGMAPFHTAVNINAILANAGFSTSQVRATTAGPAVNIYISTQGRESNGAVSTDPTATPNYTALQSQVVAALRAAVDTNPTYTLGGSRPLFATVTPRPLPTATGTNTLIGQDGGDVLAILNLGYNFDGTQNPVVLRQGDTSPTSGQLVLSQPNFYGAHGYSSSLPIMSAIFYAAGPNILSGPDLRAVSNIDVAPTILSILGVTPAPTVQGRTLPITTP
ncbi:alkaline phosphatase family protein [Anthocerotibacter panamensis]|uniref:alkaline phosphatase family protein n=1 Tax=Anthocerotibacter panamensis TaxID=2857077 RepID=UPI001C406423|nr:alkaline phosphatase family protein [Anthocerotibacter panamensis]